ncbi:Hypothetical predicted protein [Mytilus galloprovincialis]|uniref:Uncharacterized protein n=1 Tax=Mytilus galloprovincialis TaxID=29158 RepID=A0A8B6CYF3_MYTGA|nr:Hypothetical predicted protein [Mytilus galloprovincialis]
MSKLTLSKKSADKIPEKKEDTAGPSQAFEKTAFDDDVLDFSLKVTEIKPNVEVVNKREEDKTSDDFAGVISSAVKDLRKNMDTRLAAAKAREGMAYGLLNNDNIPPFCRITLSCRPDLKDREIFNELQKKWDDKQDEIKQSMLKESIEFLDNKLNAINNKMKSIMADAKDIIGVASESAGHARTELNKRFLEMKDAQQKALLEFQTDIRSRKRFDNRKHDKRNHTRKAERKHKPY